MYDYKVLKNSGKNCKYLNSSLSIKKIAKII